MLQEELNAKTCHKLIEEKSKEKELNAVARKLNYLGLMLQSSSSAPYETNLVSLISLCRSVIQPRLHEICFFAQTRIFLSKPDLVITSVFEEDLPCLK